jgi:hypothetical protein
MLTKSPSQFSFGAEFSQYQAETRTFGFAGAANVGSAKTTIIAKLAKNRLNIISYYEFHPSRSIAVVAADTADLIKNNCLVSTHAEPFVATTSGRLSSIELAIATFGDPRVNVFLTKDSYGFPGEILERFLNQSPPVVYSKEKVKKMIGVKHKMLPPMEFEFTDQTGFWKIKSHTHPMLEQGAKYWICAEPATDDSELSWYNSNLELTNNCAQSSQKGVWRADNPTNYKWFKGIKNPKAPGHNAGFRVNVTPSRPLLTTNTVARR